jgi:hypothetical protein
MNTMIKRDEHTAPTEAYTEADQNAHTSFTERASSGSKFIS